MSRRYFLIKLVSAQTVSMEQFRAALVAAVLRYFGEIGRSRIDPKVVRFDSGDLTALVACKEEGADELQATIALLSEIEGQPVAPLILRRSGTIKSLIAPRVGKTFDSRKQLTGRG